MTLEFTPDELIFIAGAMENITEDPVKYHFGGPSKKERELAKTIFEKFTDIQYEDYMELQRRLAPDEGEENE